ncbi:MATE family efflux transporter [Aquibacillus kalidii]|uniref:MATE family efflux transporter n=1 Tax=Aquibacillus kalidii TaxID=2762597 RepID=UPI001644FED2|nr:MATE family efflux transporter [Aquibacillus kalidii]
MEMSKVMEKKYSLVSLIAYATPTIVMMVFMAFYTMIDGIFLANFVSATALSAVNIFLPVYGLITAIALMLGTGGSAIVAKKMGENKEREAKENFSFIALSGSVIGVLIMLVGSIFLNPLLEVLGANANGELFQLTFDYARIILLVSPLMVLQMFFQSFFVTVGKANVGLMITIVGGVANIVLDYVFIIILQMGITGAAVATAIGIGLPAIFGTIYFLKRNENELCLVKPKIDIAVLITSFVNGSSEMVNNLSFSVVTFAYNILMIQYFGVAGVAAVTVILYVMYLIESIFTGYATGVAPIFSYNYGSKNINQLKSVFKHSLWIIFFGSVIVYGISIIIGPYFIHFMSSKGSQVEMIAMDGFRIFSITFLLIGFNIFTSVMFTAFSNGKVSGFISLLRTFVFVIVFLLILPPVIGENGIWMAVPLSEILALIICSVFLTLNRKVYHYI